MRKSVEGHRLSQKKKRVPDCRFKKRSLISLSEFTLRQKKLPIFNLQGLASLPPSWAFKFGICHACTGVAGIPRALILCPHVLISQCSINVDEFINKDK